MRALLFILASVLTSCHPVMAGQSIIKPVEPPFIVRLIQSIKITPSFEGMTNRMGHSIPVFSLNVGASAKF